MKKIYNLLLILGCLFCITSCGDDDYDYKAPESLSVEKADLYFSSAQGTGSIEVAATNNMPLTATSSVDWCTVTVSGNTVTATVVDNFALESRAGQIKLDNGTASTILSVTQEGLVMTYNKSELGHAFSYEGGSATVAFSSTSGYTVEIPADAQNWLSYTADKENGKLTFTAKASTEKTPRGAAVKVIVGTNVITYNIGEYEMQDVAGTWHVTLVDGDGNPLGGNINVVQDEEEPSIFYLAGVSSFADLPVIFSDGTIRAIAGLKMGTYAGFNIYTAVLTEGGFVNWSTDSQYVAYPTSINGKFTLVFGDNGSVEGDVVNGFAYWAFAGNPSNANSKGWLEQFNNIVLSKL